MKDGNIGLWILTGIAAFFFVTISLGNLVYSLRQITGKKSESLLPFFGGLAGVAALLLMPVEGASRYWWLPLLLDLGSLPILIWTIVWWTLIYPGHCPTEHTHYGDARVRRARVSLREKIGAEMFWKRHKRETRMYSVSDQLAWEWPRVLLPVGFSVYVGDKWAAIASAFNGGCPWGDVREASYSVQMGSEFLTKEKSPQRLADLTPGYYMQLGFVKESQPLADQIDTILREHGAMLVRSETR